MLVRLTSARCTRFAFNCAVLALVGLWLKQELRIRFAIEHRRATEFARAQRLQRFVRPRERIRVNGGRNRNKWGNGQELQRVAALKICDRSDAALLPKIGV